MDYARHRAEIQALITAKLKEAISGYTKRPNTPLEREAILKCVSNLLADDEVFPTAKLMVLTHVSTNSCILITERAKWNDARERERLTEEGWREP